MAHRTLIVSPMLYENEARIRVAIPYNPAMIQKIRLVAGARWNPEHRCWHIPKTKEAWTQLKSFFGEIEVEPASASETETKAPVLSPRPKTQASHLAGCYAPNKSTLDNLDI